MAFKIQGGQQKNLHTNVEIFVGCLANRSQTWPAYFAFMYGHLIALGKQPGVSPVGVGEMWIPLFAKCVLRFMGPESTNAFQDDQLCAVLKLVIDGAAYGVQSIWDT